MSSKEQFRDALKRAKAENLKLKYDIRIRDQHIASLKTQLDWYKNSVSTLPNKKKKWWQFWK